MKKIIFLPFLLLFFLAVPAGAVEEVTETHIKSFDIPTSNGLSITGLDLIGLEPTSNTNLTFNAYGKPYNLNIVSDKTWGWWTFDLTLTDPNGTVQTKHLSNLAPLCTSWKCHVQYYYLETDTIFDLDVYTSINPLAANLSTPNPTLSEDLQFSEVACNSSSFFDTKLYMSTEQEFQAQKEQDLSTQLSKATGDVLKWTWGNIVNFINNIPYVGVYLSAILLLTAMTLSSIIFYTQLLFIDYAETTFLTIEFFILSYAFSKKGSIWSQLSRVVRLHEKLINMVLNTAQTAVNLFTSIIQTIASIVASLKLI